MCSTGLMRSVALTRPWWLVHLQWAKVSLYCPCLGLQDPRWVEDLWNDSLHSCMSAPTDPVLWKIILQVTRNNLTPKYFLWKGGRDVFWCSEQSWKCVKMVRQKSNNWGCCSSIFNFIFRIKKLLLEAWIGEISIRKKKKKKMNKAR